MRDDDPTLGVDSSVNAPAVAEREFVAPKSASPQRERLFEAFVAHRESLGMEVVALDPGAGADRAARADVFSTLSARLRDGRLVCLVADRDLTSSGTEASLLALRVARAATGIDLLTDPQLLSRAQATFKQKSGGQPYRPTIPSGQKPPLPEPPK